MTPQETNIQDYKKLQYEYLAEAEKMFGSKTDYVYLGLYYHTYSPRTVLHDKDFLTDESFIKSNCSVLSSITVKKAFFNYLMR